jgi:Gram-negative bacterial TonB protein C-terminal
MTKWASICVCIMLLTASDALTQTNSPQKPLPHQFLVGRHTFFDFGPPFDFYEVFSVRSTRSTTSIDRITIIPPGNACTQPAKVEIARASVNKSVIDLLGTTDPCTIPEKDLRKEIKRCKKCLVFSGADVTMQVQCGQKTRHIRMDILDKDMFDPTTQTPEHTSWTMHLLGELDQALGNSVMDRPVFDLPKNDHPSLANADGGDLDDLRNGTFDSLFEKAPHKPSELFRESQNAVPAPTVKLVSSSPFPPLSPALPTYSPIARAAHVSGLVHVQFEITSTGNISNIVFVDKSLLLHNAVSSAVVDWKFPKEAAGQHIEAVFEFNLNCPATTATFSAN